MDDTETRKELLRAQNEAINALRSTLHSQELSANRNLQFLNAGGAVALLAFLGQTWDSAIELRTALVIGIAFMTIGLCIAVWGGLQLPKYTEQGFRQNESIEAAEKYKKTQKRYFWTTNLSFFAFVAAVTVVLIYVVVAG